MFTSWLVDCLMSNWLIRETSYGGERRTREKGSPMMGGITNTTHAEKPELRLLTFRPASFGPWLASFVYAAQPEPLTNQQLSVAGCSWERSEEAGDFSPSLRVGVVIFHLIGGTRCHVAGSCFLLQGGKKKSAASWQHATDREVIPVSFLLTRGRGNCNLKVKVSKNKAFIR